MCRAWACDDDGRVEAVQCYDQDRLEVSKKKNSSDTAEDALGVRKLGGQGKG